MNRLKVKYFCCLILLFVFAHLKSRANLDSLHRVLATAKIDSIKLETINNILFFHLRKNNDSAEYYNNLSHQFAKSHSLESKNHRGFYLSAALLESKNKFEEAFEQVERSLKIAKAEKNVEGIVKAELLKGEIYYDVYQTDEAIKHFMLASDLAKKTNKPDLIIDVHLSYGIFYKKIGKAPDALEQLMISYNLLTKSYENASDRDKMFSCCINLGTMYERMKELDKALEFYRKANVINNYSKDENGTAICYSKIGKIHAARKNMDSAQYYFEKTMKIHLKRNDEIGLINDYSVLAFCYSESKNYEDADNYWNKSIELALKYQDSARLIQVLIPKSLSLSQRNKINESLTLLEYAYTFITRSTPKSTIAAIFLNTSKHYATLGNFKKAYEHQVLHKQWSDSSNNLNDAKRLTELKLNFDFKNTQEKLALEERAKELENLSLREKDKLQRNYLIVGILFISLFLLIALRSYKRKNKANLLLSKQKLEIENQKKLVEHKNKEISDSIHYAKRIQYTLLANSAFLEENLSNHFIYFKPKDIVSGDFYWATKQEDKFFLAVCDSTGHGVPGAFMSLLSIGFLSEAINEKGISKPDKVFEYVRKRLIENINKDGQKDGFDGILICIDKGSNKITYSAANNRPLLIRDQNFVELEADRMPVGIGVRNNAFKLYSIDIKNNETLYLYTDGFADQFGGARGKKFMYKQLNELLLSLSSKPFEDQKSELTSAFESWSGNLEQVDDICVIGIKI